jgi:hypothetical protein
MKTKFTSLLPCVISLFVSGNTAVSGGLDYTIRPERDLPSSYCARQMQFNGVSFSHGKKGNGAEYSAGIYDSTDGVGVVMTVETYSSASLARAEMMRKIKGATRIVERVRKTDQNGKLIGKRAVVIAPGDSRDRSYATILWLDQEDLNIIESSSLHVALEFERQFHGK